MRYRYRPMLRAMMLAAILPLLAAGAAAADEAVLLSSTAPGYAPGMVVASNERLTVPEGANATLLFRSGEMMRVRGPFDGPLRSVDARSGGNESIAGLAETLRARGVDAAVVGGTRSFPGLGPRRSRDPDLLVDPQRSATYCIGAAASVWIARPDEPVDRVVLRRRGVAREIAWPAGAVRVPWPADVLVEDGDRFEIVDPAGMARATATFRTLDERSLSEAAWVARAALMGCQEQVQVALQDLARAVTPRELWLTTDRGRQPTYRAGETMRLVVQSNRDGFLYCVQWRADDSAVPIFPAGAVDGARLRGHEPLSIPGQRRAGELTAGPRGKGRVTCYLADRDVAAELPHALLSDAMPRLPENLAARLDGIFDAISGTRVLKTSISIDVE
jgi:Domain of unknown function (DUF4384)